MDYAYVTEATLAPVVHALNSLLHMLAAVPGMPWVIDYVTTSLRTDPWRLFLELVLVAISVRYVLMKGYRPKERKIKLSKKEVDELIREWEPEPLSVAMSAERQWELTTIPVLDSRSGIVVQIGGKSLVNFVSLNYLGLLNDPRVEDKAVATLKNYGVGSCSPPGFYGTVDVHLKVEKDFAAFMGTPSAILYSYAFATIASAIPAFARKGDIVVCDDGVSFATQKGLSGSRATIMLFRHNDLADLERLLKEVTDKERKKKIGLVRKFIVVEGLYMNSGDICPLREIMELKQRYRFRLMIEETNSFGVLGKTGRGVSEYFDVPINDIELITFGLCNAVGAAGGICIGSEEISDRQRLSGIGYCFSASMPPLLAAAASEALDIIKEKPALFSQLSQNIRLFRSSMEKSIPPYVEMVGHPDSPILHVRLAQRLASRFDEKRYLQSIVDTAASKGFFLTLARYVEDQEIRLPPPSIRIVLSAGHSDAQIRQCARVFCDALSVIVPISLPSA